MIPVLDREGMMAGFIQGADRRGADDTVSGMP